MTKRLPSNTEIDAVILDFGGVLFNIDYHAPARAFKALGMSNFEAIYSQASQTDLFDRLETGRISNDDFIQALAGYLPDHISRQQILDAWNIILLDIPKTRIDFIHQLHRSKRTLLLSNTNAIHVQEFEQTIDKTMSLDYFYSAFDEVYYSNVIKLKKPYPETFLQVCNWNNLDPHRVLFVDDSVQHVQGALQAGLWAYHLELPEEEITDVLNYLIA